jgi:hypothetical protein
VAAEPGSNSGRASVDWEAAFAFYASLPAGERSYGKVAARFAISPRTVERHGRLGGWKQRLREIGERAAAATDQSLADARAEEVRKMARLIEASLVGYAEKLRAGQVRMTPADLERLHKLSRQLSDEVEQPAQTRPGEEEPPPRTPEHVAAVVRALKETGALDSLGLTASPPEATKGAD